MADGASVPDPYCKDKNERFKKVRSEMRTNAVYFATPFVVFTVFILFLWLGQSAEKKGLNKILPWIVATVKSIRMTVRQSSIAVSMSGIVLIVAFLISLWKHRYQNVYSKLRVREAGTCIEELSGGDDEVEAQAMGTVCEPGTSESRVAYKQNVMRATKLFAQNVPCRPNATVASGKALRRHVHHAYTLSVNDSKFARACTKVANAWIFASVSLLSGSILLEVAIRIFKSKSVFKDGLAQTVKSGAFVTAISLFAVLSMSKIAAVGEASTKASDDIRKVKNEFSTDNPSEASKAKLLDIVKHMSSTAPIRLENLSSPRILSIALAAGVVLGAGILAAGAGNPVYVAQAMRTINSSGMSGGAAPPASAPHVPGTSLDSAKAMLKDIPEQHIVTWTLVALLIEIMACSVAGLEMVTIMFY